MGCGNSKAQKDAASSPSQLQGQPDSRLGNSAAMMATQQQQYQPQPQPQQHQQQQQSQQQYQQEQYQKQQQQQQYQQQQQHQLEQQQQQQQQQQQYEPQKSQRSQQEYPPVSAQSRREDQTNRSYSQTQEKYQHSESPEKMQTLYQSPLQNSQQVSTPAKGTARKEDYPQTYEKQQAAFGEDSQVHQQSGKSTFRNNNSFEQSGRLQTPPPAEQGQLNSGAASTNQSKVMKLPKEDAEGPQILFSFDFANKDFHFYNFKKDQWDLNNLNRSTDDCPKCPLFKYKVQGEEAEGLQFAKYMSYIALSDEVIFIIGGYNSYYSCLEYNIVSNKFYAREPLKVFRNNPSLCRYGQYIYAVSGDLLDKFSTEVSRYDTQRNEWTTLPELPSPQGFASVAVINSVKGAAPSEKTLKLAALGGLSHKFPKTYTTILSLFSFDEQKWTSFDLSRFIEPKVPRFSNCPILQTKEGDIIIFGAEGSRSVYRFDPFNMKMSTAGRLPNDEAFNDSMKSKEAFCQNDKIYCLANKLGLKAYRGSLSTNKWEVI